MLALLFAGPAQARAVPVGLESLCDRQELLVGAAVPTLPWQPLADNIVRIGVGKVCWLRLQRPAAEKVIGDPNNQFLLIENSWGSDFSLYASTGERLAHSTVSGERYRTCLLYTSDAADE